MNPTVTACALSYLAGDRIVKEYVDAPNEIIGSGWALARLGTGCV